MLFSLQMPLNRDRNVSFNGKRSIDSTEERLKFSFL